MYLVSAPIFSKALSQDNQLLVITENGQFYSANELTILSDVAEIMIPKTSTPGATDAHVIPVLDGLMLTWAGTQTKQQFRTCIKQIMSLSKETYGTDYVQLPHNLRLQLIEQLDITAFKNKKTTLSKNYRKLKEIIFHVFYTSEEANPNFVLIPGKYYGNLSKNQLEKVRSGIQL
ncbi:gluconate 2-dehydrogenase subunit 3 family protein [Paraglaciecola sp.]|uniref:gluconate 2-dehydrogenase subunit 3 family protein n=1 Tax=Paraglaciecola sp. TaxID=1920173 RepID=UPI003EF9EF49